MPASMAGPPKGPVGLGSIDLGGLAASVPAVLSGLTIVLIVLWLRSKEPMVEWYQRRAEAALGSRDLPTAYLCFKRLLQYSPADPKLHYGLALTLDTLGQEKLRQAAALRGESQRPLADEGAALRGRALSEMRKLAPEGQPNGYVPAHAWIASMQLLDPRPTPQTLRSSEEHLKAYLKADPSSAQARAMLGHVFASTGRYKIARPYLEEAVPNQPWRLVELAMVYYAVGEVDEAVSTAKKAREYYAPLVKARPDDVDTRLHLSEAESLSGDYAGAVDTLVAGMRIQPHPVFPHAIANIYRLWADSLAPAAGGVAKADPSETAVRRVELMERGLHYEPGNRELIGGLYSVATGKGSVAEKNAGRAALVTLAASGKATPEVYDYLGQEAFLRNQYAEARSYWEQAYNLEPWDDPKKLEPRHATLANNLAWITGTVPPVDVPKALAFIDRALKLRPLDAVFRGTRGEILARTDRLREAREDLRAAIDSGAATKEILKALEGIDARLDPPKKRGTPPASDKTVAPARR